MIIIIAVVAFVALIGGGGFLLLVLNDDDPPRRPLSAPTFPDIPTPTYSPYSPPTFDPPTPSSPTYSYSPPRQNWGAIAVASNGAVGKAWDYDTSSAARRRALNECPASGCKVLTTFANGCGAVAFNSRTNRYWGGSGATRSAAQRDAISNAGGGRWIAWVCTTR